MRHALRVILIVLALVGAALIGIGVPVLFRGCAPVPTPIAVAPAPPTFTPVPPTATDTPTVTWILVPPTDTPITSTRTPWVPTFTPTAAPTHTPTMWDTDTRGDTPVPLVVVKPPLAPSAGGQPLPFTGGELAGFAGVLLSLAVSYVPYLKERYAKLDGDHKRGWMGLAIVVAGSGIALLSCAGFSDWIICDKTGLFALGTNIFWALVGSQAMYLITPKELAKAPEPEEQIPVSTRART